MAQYPAPSRPPSGGQNGGTIDSQVFTTGIGPDGKATAGYDIHFTTKGGAKGQVFVPRAQYTPANVKALILAHANDLDEVARSGF